MFTCERWGVQMQGVEGCAKVQAHSARDRNLKHRCAGCEQADRAKDPADLGYALDSECGNTKQIFTARKGKRRSGTYAMGLDELNEIFRM